MMKLISILVLNLCIITWSSPLISNDADYGATEPKNETNQKLSYRLPTTTIPLSYTIILTVNPNEDKFHGHTSIHIKCVSNTDQIVLHTNNLNVTTMTVKSQSETIVILNTNHTGDDRHFFTITLNNTLIKDREYELEFDYDGPFSDDDFNGLVKNYYRDENKTIRYFMATHFQPIYARDVFPCYDEPALKAVFNIHIYAPKGYHAISNMDTIESTQPTKVDYECTSFSSTPLMSSYLIAFLVSDFEYKSNTRDGETIFPKEYRVYARPNVIVNADYALDFGQKCFKFLQNYTGVDYRLPKIDNVALPKYKTNGMENWGLIVYDEPLLLYNKSSQFENKKIVISNLISHEHSHFWFGNEVSPLWWDYLWLNEGFASFFQSYTTDKVTNNKWRIVERFLVTRLDNSLESDNVPETVAMSASVSLPAEIMNKFDYNAYSKAPCVIRMFQHVLGESVFQKSISAYLKSLPTGVADQQKLFSEMQNVVGKTNILPKGVTINDIFGSWADQAGYPLLNVTRPNPSEIRITQQRYYKNSTIVSNERWWIPLTWMTDQVQDSSNTTTQAWMTPTDSEITLLIDPSTKWILFNKQRSGYFRIMYDINMWNDLVKILNSEEHHLIPSLNKAQLLVDAATFSKTGRLTYNVTFDLLKYLSRETDVIPWTAAEEILSYLNNKMKTSNRYDLFQKFISSIARLNNTTDFEDDNYDTKEHNSLVLKIACDYGLELCTRMMPKKAGKFPQPLNSDMVADFNCNIMRRASIAMWKRKFLEYTSSESEGTKWAIINALGCSLNGRIINSYLNTLISNQSKIRVQDTEAVLKSVIYSGPFGVEKVVTFLRNHFMVLRNRLEENFAINIFESLGDVISNMELAEKFDELVLKYENNFTEDEKAEITRVKTRISENVTWNSIYMVEIDAWLEENIDVFVYLFQDLGF